MNGDKTTALCIVCRKDVGHTNAQLALRHLYAVRNEILSQISEIDLTLDAMRRFSHVEITGDE